MSIYIRKTYNNHSIGLSVILLVPIDPHIGFYEECLQCLILFRASVTQVDSYHELSCLFVSVRLFYNFSYEARI